MDNKTKTIDIMCFLKYLRSRAVIVLVTVVIFAGLVAAYDYRKQNKVVDKSGKEILKDVMTQNHDAFYFNSVKYTDASKPADVYNSEAKILIEYDYSDVETSETLNSYSIREINRLYSDDVCTIIKSGELLSEVINDLNLRAYDDMSDITPESLQWLINRNFVGGQVMNIVVSDVNPERAKSICDTVIAKLIVKLKDFSFVKSAKIISEGTLPNDGYYTISAAGNSVDKKQLIKYGIVGAFLGGVFIVAVLFILYAFSDTIFSESDVTEAGFKLAAGSRRKKADYARLAGSISLFENVEKILLVSVDDKTDACKDAEEIGKELKAIGSEIKLVGAGDFANNVDALSKVKDCDSVIYLVRYGKTKLRTLEETESILGRSAKNLGVIIN